MTTPEPDMTWAERIARAAETGTFTPNDLWRAAGWSTCPVGELYGNWTRPTLGRLDPSLRRAGLDFYDAVSGDKPVAARRIYDRIQRRVATLRTRERQP